MKVAVLQPHYSFDTKDAESCSEDLMNLFDQCDESLDLIVTPEDSDLPADARGKTEYYAMAHKYNKKVLDKAKETAVRCHALVFTNCTFETENGLRNTTYAIDETGEIIGKYFKAHPAPSEVKTEAEGGNELDVAYSYDYEKPYILEHNGIRYGFMTCYDFYFYEAFAVLARQNVDIIIGASLQRTDTHQALDIIGRFLSYNTGAYLVRASVSLGEDSPLCGSSMVVAPNGDMLLNMKSRAGMGCAEFDPSIKYMKQAGHLGALQKHYEYIEIGRRPWLYRNGGPRIIPDDRRLSYPRVCAHRGFSAVCPENSLPAYGAAIAMGADEIELDLYTTKDKRLVSIHDSTLDRVSDGHGKVWDYTLDELRRFDFGIKHGEAYKGMRIPTFEDILKKFGASVIMNIHIKEQDDADIDWLAHEVIRLLYQYDCEKHCYLMCDSDDFSRRVHEIDPSIQRCVSAQHQAWEMVDRAIEMGCQKVQLYHPYFNQEMIDKAHEHGIICNLFYEDDPEKAAYWLERGIDTILSNNYWAVAQAVEEYKTAHNG